jgi:hypothetical protein
MENQLEVKSSEHDDLIKSYDSTAQFLIQVGSCMLYVQKY